jgi:hypothetical protein
VGSAAVFTAENKPAPNCQPSNNTRNHGAEMATGPPIFEMNIPIGAQNRHDDDPGAHGDGPALSPRLIPGSD